MDWSSLWVRFWGYLLSKVVPIRSIITEPWVSNVRKWTWVTILFIHTRFILIILTGVLKFWPGSKIGTLMMDGGSLSIDHLGHPTLITFVLEMELMFWFSDPSAMSTMSKVTGAIISNMLQGVWFKMGFM